MTIPEIAIRQATQDDIADIMQLYAQPQYDDGLALDTDSAAVIFERAAHYPFYKFFVASDSDGIVGVYSLLIMENLGHMGSKSAIVEGVAVAPQVHGIGVGSTMMRHALELASKHGCYKLSLSSNLKRTGAHAFYERLGFRQHGVSYVIEPAAEATI
jgi:GNAT superfamily N-acetyltransferase